MCRNKNIIANVAKCRVNKYAHKYVNSVALDTRTENGNENNYLLIAASSPEQLDSSELAGN